MESCGDKKKPSVEARSRFDTGLCWIPERLRLYRYLLVAAAGKVGGFHLPLGSSPLAAFLVSYFSIRSSLERMY
jgi:hypothetical protein